MGIFASLWLLVSGVLKRWYFWLFALFFDPFEIFRLFTGQNPPWLRQVETIVSVPDGFGSGLLIALLAAAVWATFHEVSVRSGQFFNATRPILTAVWQESGAPFLSIRTHKAPDGRIVNDGVLCLGVFSRHSTARDVRVKVDYVGTERRYLGQEVNPRNNRNNDPIMNIAEGDTRFFQIACLWAVGKKKYSQTPCDTTQAQYEAYANCAGNSANMSIETHFDIDLARPQIRVESKEFLYLRISSENMPATFCILNVVNDENPRIEIISQRLRAYDSWVRKIFRRSRLQ